jgi:hypothetical protein
VRAGALVALVTCTALLAAWGCSSSPGDSGPGAVSTTPNPTSEATTSPVASSPVADDSNPVESVLDEQELPDGGEPQVLGPLSQADAEFETEGGGVSLGDAEVPDAVSASFPVPDGLDVQLASQVGEAAGFSGVTDLGFDALVAFYDTELPAAGYESTRSQFVDAVIAVYDFDGPDGSGQVAISSAPGGGHSVLVTYER